MTTMKWLERVLLAFGIALLSISIMTYLGGRIDSRMAVERFQAGSTATGAMAPTHELVSSGAVDFRLWSEKRIHAYKASLENEWDQPEAVLRINSIGLEVPVYRGTDDRTLNRGVGRILGTARPGTIGNVGIAGHRDGFFRGLKDIKTGDTVQLDTTTGTQTYSIDRVTIVAPNDVSVLAAEPVPTLTLVTCYPFYFVGSAPQRYIVHASLQGAPKVSNTHASASLKTRNSETKEKRR